MTAPVALVGAVALLVLSGGGSAHAQSPSPPPAPLRLALPGEACYRLTDKAPGTGGYRYLLQGIAMAGEVILTFTVLSHARDIPEIPATLSMIRSARPE